MKQFKYKKVDAFTSENSLGNPAAFLVLDRYELSEEEMLAIGREHKGFVSEVVFCSWSDVVDCKLTYYSSECEVDFCGHGTIATMYDVIRNNEALRSKEEIAIETNKKGKLEVLNRINTEDAIYITAPKAKYFKVLVSKEEISTAMALNVDSISCEYPVELIDAGLKTLIVPMVKLYEVVSVFPNEARLKEFCISNEIDIVLIFCKETSSQEFIAHTRVFAPKFGYLEDPATGSGNSAFGNYMLKNHMWDGKPVSIEQGGNDRVFNIVKLFAKDNEVLFGGKATTRIEGIYYL